MKKKLLLISILLSSTFFSFAMEKGKERKRTAEEPLNDVRASRRKAKDAHAISQSTPVFSSISASNSNSHMPMQPQLASNALDPMTLFVDQFRRTTEGMSPQTLANLQLIIQSEQLRRTQSSTEETKRKLDDFTLGIFQSWQGKIEKQLDCGCKIMCGTVHKDLDAIVQESIFTQYKANYNIIFCRLLSLLKDNKCLLMPENHLTSSINGHFDTKTLKQKLNFSLGNTSISQKYVEMLNVATQFNEQVTKISDEHDHKNLRSVLDLFTDEESETAYLTGVARFWSEMPKSEQSCGCTIFSKDANMTDKILHLLAEKPRDAHGRLEKLLNYSLKTKRIFSHENNGKIDFENIKKQLSSFSNMNFERIRFLIEQYNEKIEQMNQDHNHQFIEDKKPDYSFMYT